MRAGSLHRQQLERFTEPGGSPGGRAQALPAQTSHSNSHQQTLGPHSIHRGHGKSKPEPTVELFLVVTQTRRARPAPQGRGGAGTGRGWDS